MTYTQFTRTPPSEAAQYPESELVVRTQGVFGPDNMLIGAEVSYFITQPEGGHRAVALDKKQRETVHEAMGRQLSSDPIKMRRLY